MDTNTTGSTPDESLEPNQDAQELAKSIDENTNEPSTSSPTTADKKPPVVSKQQKEKIPVESSKVPFWDDTQVILKKLEEEFKSRVILFYVARDSRLTEEVVSELYNHLKKIGKQ